MLVLYVFPSSNKGRQEGREGGGDEGRKVV
jgi:hypothetical protein